VWTLPVMLGKPGALAAAVGIAAVGCVAGLWRLLAQAQGSAGGAVHGALTWLGLSGELRGGRARGGGAGGRGWCWDGWASPGCTAACPSSPPPSAHAVRCCSRTPAQHAVLRCAAGAADAGWALLAPLSVLAWSLARLCSLAWGIHRSGFHPDAVGHAVDACLKPVGLGIILLAALA